MGTGTAIGDILIFVGDRGTARIGTAISLGRGMFFLVIFGACASTHGVFFFCGGMTKVVVLLVVLG